MDQCAESAIDWEITTNKLSLPIEVNLDLGFKESRLRVKYPIKLVDFFESQVLSKILE